MKTFSLSATTSDTAEMRIYGPIGGGWFEDGVTAQDVADALDSLDSKVKTLNVHMDSPGGSINEGFTIYNRLAQHRATVNMFVDGWAASAASVILMAADTRHIAENGMVMIHQGWGVTIGNKQDHRQTADLLNKLDDQIASTYAKRTGQSMSDITKWMEEETWFTGNEAVAKGFADQVIPMKSKEGSASAEMFTRFAAQYRHGTEMLNRFHQLAAKAPELHRYDHEQLRRRLNLLRNAI